MFEGQEALAAEARAGRTAEELDRLTEEIQVYETGSIVTFGAEAAGDSARAAEDVLQTIRSGRLSDPGPLLEALGAIMKGFDMEELSGEEKKGRFFFRKPKNGPDQVLEKYRRMGEEVDRAYIALKRYEAEIQAWDEKLRELFEAAFRTYRRLVGYIQAGEQGCREIQEHLARMEARLARTPGDAALSMDRDSLRQALTLLERRVQDLRVGEITALQSLPAIQTMRRNNQGLIDKIDTAFLVTLPIFRQALGRALAWKRQRLQAQAMEALDRRTRSALGGLRTQPGQDDPQSQRELEEAWSTIMDGIGALLDLKRQAGEEQAGAVERLEALREPGGPR